MKGFSPKWIKWVETFILGGSVAINVNDEIGHFPNKERPSSQICKILIIFFFLDRIPCRFSLKEQKKGRNNHFILFIHQVMQLDSYTLFSLFVAYEINVQCLAARAGKPCALAMVVAQTLATAVVST
jgi:hypothetical protein